VLCPNETILEHGGGGVGITGYVEDTHPVENERHRKLQNAELGFFRYVNGYTGKCDGL
jgi:hypothetical protein